MNKYCEEWVEWAIQLSEFILIKELDSEEFAHHFSGLKTIFTRHFIACKECNSLLLDHWTPCKWNYNLSTDPGCFGNNPLRMKCPHNESE